MTVNNSLPPTQTVPSIELAKKTPNPTTLDRIKKGSTTLKITGIISLVAGIVLETSLIVGIVLGLTPLTPFLPLFALFVAGLFPILLGAIQIRKAHVALNM